MKVNRDKYKAAYIRAFARLLDFHSNSNKPINNEACKKLLICGVKAFNAMSDCYVA